MKHGRDISYVQRIWGHGRYFMTDGEVTLAASLWKLGLDTHEIASKLKVHESAIYNRLNLIKAT